MKMNNPNQDNPEIRAASYCRTSGKDRTSISTQKKEDEGFIAYNKWKFAGHYVDEHKSGAKVAGRDDYQRLIRDAKKGLIDILVPFDISRFARDGLDIIRDSDMLKMKYGVYVVDSKGQFDNRDHHRIRMNYMLAGDAEAERLSIMERTIKGRIANAEKGLKWTRYAPDGREFRYNKKKEKWECVISKKGKMLRKLLPRYADGEPLALLAREFGIKFPQTINRSIRQGQLSGQYISKYDTPEVDIDREIPVPGIPEVITPELERRCRERAAHNHKWNKQAKRKYKLTGFLYCAHCGHSLKGRVQGHLYYNHYYEDSKLGCPFCSIRGDVIEPLVLDYLFNFFLNEPAYNKAVENAMPNDEDRQALEKDIKQVDKQIAQSRSEINNLVNAVAKGADVSLLTDKQDELKTAIKALENRKGGLSQTLANMPDPQNSQLEAELLRLELIYKYGTQDWRELSYEEIRQFLHHLFSDNPKKNGYGIFVDSNGLKGKKRKYEISFEGCVEFLAEEELYQRLIERADTQLETIAELENQSVKPKTLNK